MHKNGPSIAPSEQSLTSSLSLRAPDNKSFYRKTTKPSLIVPHRPNTLGSLPSARLLSLAIGCRTTYAQRRYVQCERVVPVLDFLVVRARPGPTAICPWPKKRL